MELTFGLLAPDELAQDARLRSQAFSVDAGPVDPDRPRVPLDRVHVARQNGKLVGTATVFSFGQWFGGRSVPMGGVAGVAVTPEARGKGVARRLMHDAIVAMRERGEVLSALYPTTATLYRSVGYEFAGRYERTTIPVHTVAAAVDQQDGAELTVEQVQGTDVGQLRTVYDQVAAESPGWLNRSDLFWDRLGHEINPDRHNRFCYVLRDSAGVARAGLTVSHRSGDEPLMFGLDIGGPFADSPSSMRAALSLLAALGTTADRATFSLPVEQLGLVLPPAYLDHADSWLWMARIVDVPGALTARGYNPSITAELELTVRDPLASWNTGRWSVAVADGSATVTKRSDTSPSGADELVVDIQSLSGLYTGYVSPAELIRAGRLDSASPQAVAALAAVFAGPAPRMVDFF